MMAITALTDVETLEVSLVPEGANKKKRFPVLKTAETTAMSDILHAVIDAPSSEDNKFDRVVKSGPLQDNPEAAEAIKGAMKILNAYSDSISPEAAIGVMSEGLGVRKATEFEEGKESEGTTLADEDELDKEQTEFEEGKESEGTTLADQGELDKATEFEEGKESEGTTLADEDELDKEDTEKSIQKSLESLPAAVRNQMTALWKSNREEIKKREELEKALKAERDERLRKEFVEKANSEFPHVPGKSPEELGLMLKTLHGVVPKIAEDLEGIFKSVSVAIEKTGLLKELGSGLGSRSGGASAYAKLDGMAREAVSKSGDSYAKAFETAMKNNPELYSQYLDEQGQ
jgi:hypothetical protein